MHSDPGFGEQHAARRQWTGRARQAKRRQTRERNRGGREIVDAIGQGDHALPLERDPLRPARLIRMGNHALPRMEAMHFASNRDDATCCNDSTGSYHEACRRRRVVNVECAALVNCKCARTGLRRSGGLSGLRGQ